MIMTRIATWNSARDVWETEAVSLLSGRSDVFSGIFPILGMTVNGVAYELPTSAHHTEGSGSLSSRPDAKVFPTPDASVANDGEGPDTFLARRERVKAKGINGNGMGMPLTIAVQLLPTPRSNEANGIGVHGMGGQDLRTTVALLPTPNTMEHLPVREGEARERARYRGDMGGSRRERAGNLRERVVEELEPVLSPQFCMGETDWGPYAAAISRWEAVLGRPAPEPTEEGPKGGRRLSAAFVEWMMGLPEGWVTGHGLPRTAELKMLGNGCVPQQVIAALREMVS